MTQFTGSRDVYTRTFCGILGCCHLDGEQPKRRYIYENIYIEKKRISIGQVRRVMDFLNLKCS